MADDSEDGADTITPAERVFIRISWLQTVLAVAGVFTGAVALYAALHESAAVRRQSQAAVWPYVQLLTEDSLAPGASFFTVRLTNAGLGPARIETLKLEVNDIPVMSWKGFVETALQMPEVRFGTHAAIDHVLRPGEQLDLFSVSGQQVTERILELVEADEMHLSYCYCSIFEDCWVMETDLQKRPAPIDRCPDFKEATFQN